MRLIDADKLKKHYAWWGDGRQELFDSIVGQQQTVDAVPVEFIKERISYLNELIDYEINEQGDWDGRSMHGQAELKLLLREWRTRND